MPAVIEATIVKVQLSQGDGGASVLIYDRRNKLFHGRKGGYLFDGPTPDAIRDLMYGRDKAYFYATIDGTELTIGDETGPQRW